MAFGTGACVEYGTGAPVVFGTGGSVEYGIGAPVAVGGAIS